MKRCNSKICATANFAHAQKDYIDHEVNDSPHESHIEVVPGSGTRE